MSKAILIGLLLAGSVVFLQAGQPPSIVTSPNASDLERLAAREVRRYAFLRTGALLPLATDPSASPAIRLKTDPALQAQEYRLRTQGASLTISGGTGVAVLYGAYAYAEKLGVRFQIDGDVLPDAPAATLLPTLDETPGREPQRLDPAVRGGRRACRSKSSMIEANAIVAPIHPKAMQSSYRRRRR